MYVLFPKDPERCQVGKIWSSSDESAKVRSDRYVFCRSPHLMKKLTLNGFNLIETVTYKEAASMIGVPIPVVNRWAASGKLTSIDECMLRLLQVQQLISAREVAA